MKSFFAEDNAVAVDARNREMKVFLFSRIIPVSEQEK